MILILSINNKNNYDKNYHVDRVTPLTNPVNGKEQLPLIYGSISKDISNSIFEKYNKTYMNHFSCSGFLRHSRSATAGSIRQLTQQSFPSSIITCVISGKN